MSNVQGMAPQDTRTSSTPSQNAFRSALTEAEDKKTKPSGASSDQAAPTGSREPPANPVGRVRPSSDKASPTAGREAGDGSHGPDSSPGHGEVVASRRERDGEDGRQGHRDGDHQQDEGRAHDAHAAGPGSQSLRLGEAPSSLPTSGFLASAHTREASAAEIDSSPIASAGHSGSAVGLGASEYGLNHVPPRSWPGWKAGPHVHKPPPPPPLISGRHGRFFYYGPNPHAPHRPVGPFVPTRPDRPDPKALRPTPPVHGIRFGGTAALPSMAQLSPRFTALAQRVGSMEGAVFKQEMTKIDRGFEKNGNCLWDGTKLSPAQKTRYLYDLQSALPTYIAYKEFLKRDPEHQIVSNADDIWRSFHMRIDRLNRDPDVQYYMRNEHMKLVAEEVHANPELHRMLTDTLQNDIVDGGILRAAQAHGAPPADAMRLFQLEYGQLQSMMTPFDVHHYAGGVANAVGQFITQHASPDQMDSTSAAQVQAYYNMRDGNPLGDLAAAAEPFAKSLAERLHLEPKRVASDLASLISNSINFARKGIKYSEAQFKAGTTINWDSINPRVRADYQRGIFHIANMLSGGAALGVKLGVGSGRPQSASEKAALAFQSAGMLGVGLEGTGKFLGSTAELRAKAPFNASSIENAGKLLGGLGGLTAGFMTLIKSAQSGDPTSATLGSIQAFSSAVGSGATAMEGAMYFSGVSQIDAARPLRYGMGYIGGAWNARDASSAMRRSVASLGGTLARDFNGGAGEMMITRVGLASVGFVAAGVGDVLALGFMAYDFVKSLQNSRKINHFRDETNRQIEDLFGRDRRMKLETDPHFPDIG